MKRINSLSDLLMEELADLLNTENHLVEVLPKMAQASQLSALKVLLEEHRKVTKDQAYRLKDIFSNTGQSPHGGDSKAIKEFMAEIEDVMNKTEKCPERDSEMIRVTQRMGQYEITGYRTACEHAADLGHTRIVELLNKSLDEERVMNLYLNELAQYMINVQAIDPSGPARQSIGQQDPPSEIKNGGFYIPEGKFGRGRKNKKSKKTDTSRFISEGNSNIQEEEKGDRKSQNPEEQGDLS